MQILSWPITKGKKYITLENLLNNMNEHKRQHYLPSGYMKYFSSIGETQGRKTHIFYTDATQSRDDKTVNSLSCDDYHYSRGNAKEVEESFQQMENNYPPLVEKILKAEGLSVKEYYGMIATMVEYHARNPSYENLTTEENYDAYQQVSRGMMSEIFGELSKRSENSNKDFRKMIDFLKNNWMMKRIHSENEKFISSDHPSLFFSINNDLAFIFLPISPHYGVIAVDKRKIQIVDVEANYDDIANLNGLQAARCINYVYSDHDLSEYIGKDKPITNWFNKEKPRGFVKSDCWKPEYIPYDSSRPHSYSFLKIL